MVFFKNSEKCLLNEGFIVKSETWLYMSHCSPHFSIHQDTQFKAPVYPLGLVI